jgi:hypothetical protein
LNKRSCHEDGFSAFLLRNGRHFKKEDVDGTENLQERKKKHSLDVHIRMHCFVTASCP